MLTTGPAIHPKISNEALEAYSHCLRKFHLLLFGERGEKTDYDLMRTEARTKTRRRAIETYLADQQSATGLSLTRSRLMEGSQIILDGIYEDDDLSLVIDGVQRIPDVKNPGAFSFLPILLSDSMKVRKQQRLVLQVYGSALSNILGQPVHTGLVWDGRGRPTKVRLHIDRRDFTDWLQGLFLARRASSPPSLLLNDHCHVCEFQARCRKQAIEEDNLSLLRGMTENEIANYNSRGLFTINQLSYTFRSRRKPKRAIARTGPHYFSL
jgi:predicted RecB family nuclease